MSARVIFTADIVSPNGISHVPISQGKSAVYFIGKKHISTSFSLNAFLSNVVIEKLLCKILGASCKEGRNSKIRLLILI
jgi:hypothetical protein